MKKWKGERVETMIRKTSVLAILFFSICCLSGLALSQDNDVLAGKKEAERIWELAIKAKGGRERLTQVESIQGSSVRKAYRRGRIHELRDEFLAVLPNKIWSYRDDGPGVFGVIVAMLDYDSQTMYFGQRGSQRVAKPMSDGDRRAISYQNTTLFYLMESKWLQPIPQAVEQGKIGRADVYILQTDANGRRVDFVLDRQNFLPIEVRTHDAEKDGKVFIHVCKLLNYTQVDGIMVPQLENYEGQGLATLAIRFNVEYNPEIFKALPADVRPDSWKSIR